jgi:hypothetical protein
MKNYKLIISYDGTNFYGFQIQKDKTTVQGEFQKALEIFTKKYELNYSGRDSAKFLYTAFCFGGGFPLLQKQLLKKNLLFLDLNYVR